MNVQAKLADVCTVNKTTLSTPSVQLQFEAVTGFFFFFLENCNTKT